MAGSRTRSAPTGGDEAALYVVEAAGRTLVRAEMIEAVDQLIAGVTV